MEKDENINKKIRHDIIADNKTLFQMAGRPMTETCMCWGLECGDGWLRPLSDACARLEGLNAMFYKLFKVRVQADQIKEKFGTLHFYTSVVCDPNAFVCWYEKQMRKLFDRLRRIDYNCKTVVDSEPYTELVTKVLSSKEEFEEEFERCKRISNVEVKCDSNGRYLKVTKIQHYRQTHQSPQKHKLLYWLFKKEHSVVNFMRKLMPCRLTSNQQAALALADYMQNNIVKEAEHECYNVCEKCGTTIGTSYSPRCTTTGWITYICDECADKMERPYYKNDELWQAGKLLKTKEQVEQESKQKHKHFLEDCDNEDKE